MKKIYKVIFFLLIAKSLSAISISLPSTPAPSGVNPQDKTPFQSYSKNHQENVNISTLDLNILTVDLEASGRQLNLIVQKSYSSSPSDALKSFSPSTVLGNNWFLSINGINKLFGENYSGDHYNQIYIRLASGSVNKYTFDNKDGDFVYYKRADLTWETETYVKGKYIDTTKNKLIYKKSTREYIYKTVDSVNYYFSFYMGNEINLKKITDIYNNKIEIYYGTDNKISKIQDTLNRNYSFHFNSDGFLEYISAYQKGGTTYQHSKYKYSEGKLIEYEDAENRKTKYIYESDNKRIRKVIYPSGGYTEYEYTPLKQRIENDIYYRQGTLTSTDWPKIKEYLQEDINGPHLDANMHIKKGSNQDTGKTVVKKRIRTRFSDTNIKESTEYTKNIKYHGETVIYFEGALKWKYYEDYEEWGLDSEGGIGSVESKQLYSTIALVHNYTEVKDQLGHKTYYYADSSGSITKTINPPYTDSKGNTYKEIVKNNYTHDHSTITTNHNIEITQERWYEVCYDDEAHTVKISEKLINHTKRKEVNWVLGSRYYAIEKRTTPISVSEQRTVNHYSYLFQPISIDNKIKVNNTEHLINKTTYTFNNDFNIIKEHNSIDGHIKESTYDFKEDAQDNIAEEGFIYNRVTEKWEQNKSHDRTMDVRVKLSYDDYGNLTKIEKNINDSLEKLTEYEYDNTYPGNLKKITDANGNITEYEYSSSYGNAYPSKTIKYLEGSQIYSHYEYDFYTGNILALIDYKGNRIEYKYDKLNRLIYTKNPDGSTKEINYSTSLQKSEILLKNSRGKLLQKTIKYYGDLGKILTRTTEDGQNSETFNKILYIYNERGELSKKIDDPENNKITTKYTYDSTGRLKIINFPDGGKKTYSYYYDMANKFRVIEESSFPTSKETDKQTIIKYYNFKGQLLKIEYPEVKANGFIQTLTTEYDYDELGNQTLIQDANGNIKKIYYDEFNRKTKIVYPDNSCILNTYDLLGNIIQKKDPNGYHTQIEYNELYKTKKITDPMGYTTEYFYDANGNKIKEKDAKGNITLYEYDKKTRLIKVTDAIGYSIQYTYDAMDNKIKETDKNGNTTQYFYDGLTRLIKVKNSIGETTETTYNNLNQKVSQKDPKGNSTYFTYDKMNRVIESKDALGNINTINYDNLGNKKLVKDSENREIKYFYDKLNRLSEVKNHFYFVKYEYDALGNKIKEIDGENNTQKWIYDNNNRVKVIEDAKAYQTIYTYDKLDNVISIRDKAGNITRYEYDSNYRKIKEICPGGKEIKYEYDNVGNLIKKTDEAENITEYQYNQRYELTNVIKPEGTIKYKYDSEGNVLEINDEAGKEKYYYDTLNRLIEKQIKYSKLSTNANLQQGYKIRQEYDINGNISKIKLPSGAEINYDYNKNNWMTELIALGQTVSKYKYDKSGKNTKAILGNETENLYNYDEIGRLIGQEVLGKYKEGTSIAKGLIFGEYYSYDNANNRIVKKDLDNIETRYGYDKNYQLTGVDYEYKSTLKYDQEYVYDSMGNRLNMKYKYGKIEYEYNTINYQLKKYAINEKGIVKYEYDSKGNTTRKINLTGNQKNNEFKYTFDSENRLTKIWHKNYKLEKKLKGSDSQEKAITEINYFYNSAGMRVKTQDVIARSGSDEAISRYYIYSGNNVIAELNDQGKITTEFIYGLEKTARIDYPAPVKADTITSDTPPSKTKLVYFHNNPIGSASLLTDDQGFLLQEYHYSPFGNIIFARGSDGNRYRFAGKEYDIETGLSYFGARFYDPMTGRFISKDPVSFSFEPSSHNPYVYCANNPYKYTDPNGEFIFAIFQGIASAFSGGSFWKGFVSGLSADLQIFTGIVRCLAGDFSGAISIGMGLYKGVAGTIAFSEGYNPSWNSVVGNFMVDIISTGVGFGGAELTTTLKDATEMSALLKTTIKLTYDLSTAYMTTKMRNIVNGKRDFDTMDWISLGVIAASDIIWGISQASKGDTETASKSVSKQDEAKPSHYPGKDGKVSNNNASKVKTGTVSDTREEVVLIRKGKYTIKTEYFEANDPNDPTFKKYILEAEVRAKIDSEILPANKLTAESVKRTVDPNSIYVKGKGYVVIGNRFNQKWIPMEKDINNMSMFSSKIKQLGKLGFTKINLANWLFEFQRKQIYQWELYRSDSPFLPSDPWSYGPFMRGR